MAFDLSRRRRAGGGGRGWRGLGAPFAGEGWFPYTIPFSFRVTEAYHPHGFVIDAWGDLTGRGEWTIAQDGPFVAVTYDWRIRAEKALLRWLSPVVKPVLRSNHGWKMRKGEESLALELLRRRDPSAAVRGPWWWREWAWWRRVRPCRASFGDRAASVSLVRAALNMEG